MKDLPATFFFFLISSPAKQLPLETR